MGRSDALGTVFLVRLSRGGRVARELLGERFTSILATDSLYLKRRSVASHMVATAHLQYAGRKKPCEQATEEYYHRGKQHV